MRNEGEKHQSNGGESLHHKTHQEWKQLKITKSI
jgi:hypothetical protein